MVGKVEVGPTEEGRAAPLPGPTLRLTSDPRGEEAKIISVDWLDPRAVHLRESMDREMTAVYASQFSLHSPEAQRELGAAFTVEPSTVVATVLAIVGTIAVGHAGLRPYGDRGSLEVKKVIVGVAHRGRGFSRRLMVELERIARERDAPSLVLQTGDRQPAAIALYESLGFSLIPSYPPFQLMANALCYEKILPRL